MVIDFLIRHSAKGHQKLSRFPPDGKLVQAWQMCLLKHYETRTTFEAGR